jgi:hypothetical protein
MIRFFKTRALKSRMSPAMRAFIDGQFDKDLRFSREQRVVFDGVAHYALADMDSSREVAQRELLVRYFGLQGHRSEVRADEMVVYFDCADDEPKHQHLKRADAFARGVTKASDSRAFRGDGRARLLAGELDLLSGAFGGGVSVASVARAVARSV